MHRLKNSNQEPSPWYIMFADDIVLLCCVVKAGKQYKLVWRKRDMLWRKAKEELAKAKPNI